VITNTPTVRHYGMDWLRIAAFAILIFYHSALYFGPHAWVVRADHTYEWLSVPLAFISPWRLLILFTVSGFATAIMIAKMDGIFAFFKERSLRLLLPLFFGITVLIPPQSWVRVVTANGYNHGFLQFVRDHYFRFSTFEGHTFPHWEHLWFLGYLWAYTGLLLVFIAAVPRWQKLLSSVSQFLSRGSRVLYIPIAFLVFSHLALLKLGLNSFGMFDDWVGDSHYLPAFIFGFALAVHPPLWKAIANNWRKSIITAAFSYMFITLALYKYHSAEQMPQVVMALNIAADNIMGWSVMIALLHAANVALNHDHKWRQPLARAVFPAYLVHQTVIVMIGYWLLWYNLPAPIVFAVIIGAVVAASYVAYQLGSRLPLAGKVLGVFNRT
jgi:glucans biosynthesis protein C